MNNSEQLFQSSLDNISTWKRKTDANKFPRNKPMQAPSPRKSTKDLDNKYPDNDLDITPEQRECSYKGLDMILNPKFPIPPEQKDISEIDFPTTKARFYGSIRS